MKHLLPVLLFSFSAFAQAPVILSITPNSGPDTGGTSVVITGNNLHTAVACVLPCPPRVVFGDIAVDAVEVSAHRIDVTTPAHAPGVVDVTVVIPGREPAVVQDGFTFLEGPESAYERVLLPIYVKDTVPGSHGTRWATDLWIHNGGGEPVLLADVVCAPEVVCPPVIPLTVALQPGHSLHNPTQFFTPGRTNPGQLLYISKQGAQDVSLGLRVADTSRNSLNGGTELPVIREGEFLTRAAQLHGVPLDNRNFRILLRVYDVTYSEALFAVQFFAADENATTPIYGTTLTAKTPRVPPFRGEAAYAELDITPLLNLRLAWPEVARIQIRPMTPGSRYWAMLSLTNNETQLVTLVTPQ